MIIQVERVGAEEVGFLVTDDRTSRLVLRTKWLPAEVALKAYLAAVRGELTSGTIESRSGADFRWEVLGMEVGGAWWKRRRWQTLAHV